MNLRVPSISTAGFAESIADAHRPVAPPPEKPRRRQLLALQQDKHDSAKPLYRGRQKRRFEKALTDIARGAE